MKKKSTKSGKFISGSEVTVDKEGRPKNIPSSGEMKGNPVFFGKQVGVKPTKELKQKLEKDSQDITDDVVAESAEEDKYE